MQTFIDILDRFFAIFIWWAVIQPWEQGLLVRLGKSPRLLSPGLHFRIPYVDAIYRQAIRRRNSNFGPQTVTTSDGATLTISGTIAYSIKDILELYDRLHHPEDAIASTAQAAISGFVTARALADCTPPAICAACRSDLGLRKFGILVHDVSLTTFARVRTYRLITDTADPATWGDVLDTNAPDRPGERR